MPRWLETTFNIAGLLYCGSNNHLPISLYTLHRFCDKQLYLSFDKQLCWAHQRQPPNTEIQHSLMIGPVGTPCLKCVSLGSSKSHSNLVHSNGAVGPFLSLTSLIVTQWP